MDCIVTLSMSIFFVLLQQSGSFTAVTGTYVFEPVKYSSENHSLNPKYMLRKVKYEGKFSPILKNN